MEDVCIWKGLGAQVVFSILPAGDWDPGRRRRKVHLNDWLHGWCHAKGYRFYDLGHSFEKLEVLTWDGMQMTRRGKNILGSRLARLITRALN